MQARFSRVNVRKLIKDLADMYPDAPFDVVVSELVANALDAKASTIRIDWDDNKKILVIADDGRGMSEDDFEAYHDIAVESKFRGASIGFAGVGAKISFNIAHRVLTETRFDGEHESSIWQWQADQLEVVGTNTQHLKHDGTRVEVNFRLGPGLPSIDNAYITGILQRHYLPLLIDDFLRGYGAIELYSPELRFEINGHQVPIMSLDEFAQLRDAEDFLVKSKSNQVGWGKIGLAKIEQAGGLDTRGIWLCTHGKVIKAESLDQHLASPDGTPFGVVEIPELVNHITTSKSDFQRRPGGNVDLERLLGPVRDQLRRFLEKHGVEIPEKHRNRLTTRLERDLSKMLPALPELRQLSGLLRRSERLRRDEQGEINASNSGGEATEEARNDQDQSSESTSSSDNSDGRGRQEDEQGQTRTRRQRSRRNQGPQVTFEDHPRRHEVSWLDGGTVVINSALPTYLKRAKQNEARVTYCIFAIGSALQKAGVAGELDDASYLDRFITVWGQ